MSESACVTPSAMDQAQDTIAAPRPKFIAQNLETDVYWSMAYSRAAAEKQAEELQSSWAGLSWEVQRTEQSFPIPGLIHFGEVRAAGILRRAQKLLEVA